MPGEGNGRERWWRALHRSTHWETADFLGDPAAREVVDELLLQQVDQRRRTLAAYIDQRRERGDDWEPAGSLNDYAMRMRPEDAVAMADELTAVLARWSDASEPPTADPQADGDVRDRTRPRPSRRPASLGVPAVTLTVAAAGRRYVGLTALRWLPVGLSVPVTVLLAQSRGLSVAQVGLVFAVYGMVCLVLELPTGGLADAIGRRPVLVLSGSLHLLGLLGLAIAPNLPPSSRPSP